MANVRLTAYVPEGMEILDGTGPTEVTIQDGRVEFAPLPKLGPGADVIFRVHARGLQPGDQRFKVELNTDQMQQPVREEESTRVYAD